MAKNSHKNSASQRTLYTPNIMPQAQPLADYKSGAAGQL